MSAALVESVREAIAAREATPGAWHSGPETGAGHVWIYMGSGPFAEPTHWLKRAFQVRTDGEVEWKRGEDRDASKDRFWRLKQDRAAAIVACGNLIAEHGPAILAALTEAEALRAQVVAGQAREVALREALTLADAFIRQVTGVGASHTDAFKTGEAVGAALSAPTDTAALRAFGERCVEAGRDDYFDEIRAMDAGVPRAQQDAAAIVDRILGGS